MSISIGASPRSSRSVMLLPSPTERNDGRGVGDTAGAGAGLARGSGRGAGLDAVVRGGALVFAGQLVTTVMLTFTGPDTATGPKDVETERPSTNATGRCCWWRSW